MASQCCRERAILWVSLIVRTRDYGQLMTTVELRLKDVEVRVDRLETWAGPGQAEALSVGLSALRAEIAAFRQEVNRAFRDVRAEMAGIKSSVSALETDVAGLKSDMADIKGVLEEILRRLPPAA